MREPMALLALLGLCLQMAPPGRVEAMSIVDKIPGVQLLKDLTYSSVETLNSVLDDTIELVAEPLGVKPECLKCNLKDPDTGRSVAEIIRSRGFGAEEYDVVTKDQYVLTIQRIVNPLVAQEQRARLRPVMLQHGLMSSSVDWVINSVNVKPEVYPKPSASPSANATAGASDELPPPSLLGDSQEHPNSLGFYLANQGYDVFLGNSRGNIYGSRHLNMTSSNLDFWDFSFDEQIKFDLPDTIEFILKLTNHSKLGYVGHSQGTVMMFGLLSDQPQYADIVEPFVALAPVAYCDHTVSPVKYFSIYTPVFQHINMWFATPNVALRYLGPIVCGPKVVRRDICANILFLSVGFDEAELDDGRVSAYLSHMPSGTSVKNIAHYGQEVLSRRFAHYDHGLLANQVRYGQAKPPDYDLSKIRSKSMVLFTADNDWLAAPKDVARLRSALTVQPYAVYNISQFVPKWNHIDFVYGKHAGELVNTRIIKVFEHFRNQAEQESQAAAGEEQ